MVVKISVLGMALLVRSNIAQQLAATTRIYKKGTLTFERANGKIYLSPATTSSRDSSNMLMEVDATQYCRGTGSANVESSTRFYSLKYDAGSSTVALYFSMPQDLLQLRAEWLEFCKFVNLQRIMPEKYAVEGNPLMSKYKDSSIEIPS